MEEEPFICENVLFIKFPHGVEKIDGRIKSYSGLLTGMVELDEEAGTEYNPLHLNIEFKYFTKLNEYYSGLDYDNIPDPPKHPLKWANKMTDIFEDYDVKFISSFFTGYPAKDIKILMSYGNIADYLQLDSIMFKIGACVAFIIKTNDLEAVWFKN
jgi:hypothetical protein